MNTTKGEGTKHTIDIKKLFPIYIITTTIFVVYIILDCFRVYEKISDVYVRKAVEKRFGNDHPDFLQAVEEFWDGDNYYKSQSK